MTLLESNPVLPFHIEHVTASHATDISTLAYDLLLDNPISDPCRTDHDQSSVDVSSASTSLSAQSISNAEDIPFPSVVISDVNNLASSSQMAAAAIRHLHKKGGAFLQIPHNPQPANEYFNPHLFPMMYPTLFPYGIGGFEDNNCHVKLSMHRYIKHLFNLHDQH